MPNAPDLVLCSKLCLHNPLDPTQNKGRRAPGPLPLDAPLQIDKYKEITGFDVYPVKTLNDLYHVFHTCDNIILSVTA